MNTPCTLGVITGFAYMLEHVKDIFDFKKEGVNHAYLFSYESHLKNRYLDNLMQLMLNTSDSSKNPWINYCAADYAKKPILKREEFFANCHECFAIQRTSLPEDTFDFSVLNACGRGLGRDICQDHGMFFQNLVKDVCERQSVSRPECSCGIIFTTSD